MSGRLVLGWMALAGALALGCGGKVFVDGSSSGSGGAGTGSGGAGGVGVTSTTGGGAGCPAGTCRLSAGGDCEAPGGPQGNGCCKCGSDGLCAEVCECAAPDTAVATPDGERSIASLREGDLVYSVEGMQVVAVPILATHQTAVGPDHRMVRVRMANGSTLEISGGHPTLDGRVFHDLATGGELGGVRMVEVGEVGYGYDRTYDILPASESGGYFAGGVLIGSTMKPNARVDVRRIVR